MYAGSFESGPAYVLRWESNKLTVTEPDQLQILFTKDDLIDYCVRTIFAAFQRVKPNSNVPRLVYALAGRLFQPSTPYPIGGKKKPGYHNYDGSTPTDLLRWIASNAVVPPLMGRGHRNVEPGTCLRFCAEKINELLLWERNGNKDEMDNALLSGLAKSTRYETVSIPLELRHGAAVPFSSRYYMSLELLCMRPRRTQAAGTVMVIAGDFADLDLK
ncbi:hypothetical protein HDU97_001150 [Phlyctochytrium planicorne]|nr:hypothetical protein HDU97_001150 [Phlyctochytrium planicorne]